MNETILIASGITILLALGVWGGIYYLTYAVRSQTLGRTVWHGDRNSNSVALTFDDGPSPDTLEILDVLRRENVKATFFLIGKKVEEYPEIARKIVEDGHELGNHSYSHPIYLFCSNDRTLRELRRTQRCIKDATGVEPRFARPPCGVRTPGYFSAAKDLNLRTIQWSDAGFDWKNIPAQRIAQNILKTIQNGSIVLLHDGDETGKDSRGRTTEALQLLLGGLREKGLSVSPLAEICPGIHDECINLQFLPPIL